MTAGGGTVAMAANASSVVWAPPSMVPFYSTTYGSSWTASTGAPAGGVIASDRVNPQYYYYYAAGQFYVSSNGGVSFTATAASGLPVSGDPVVVKAVPGIAGDVWVVGGSDANTVYGMWHSTNYGASFTKLANVTQADVIGFGKAGPGASYQTIFTNAEIGGVRGIFASTNKGVTWQQINDAAMSTPRRTQAMTGDPQVFGTVYIGTNGRGIVMGTGSPTVSSSGTFTLKPSAATLSVAQGASGTDTITVTDVSPFTGSVALAATGMPTGVTASFSPTSSATSSVLTLTASSTAAAGTYTITVTGTSGTLTPDNHRHTHCDFGDRELHAEAVGDHTVGCSRRQRDRHDYGNGREPLHGQRNVCRIRHAHRRHRCIQPGILHHLQRSHADGQQHGRGRNLHGHDHRNLRDADCNDHRNTHCDFGDRELHAEAVGDHTVGCSRRQRDRHDYGNRRKPLHG